MKVLATSRLSNVEKDRCLRVALLINDPKDAQRLTSEDSQWLMKKGEFVPVYVLSYRGVEVRLFYKRQMFEDFSTNGVQVENTLGEWLVINLLGVDDKPQQLMTELAYVKQSNLRLGRQIEEDRQRNMTIQANYADELNELRAERDKLKEKIDEWRKLSRKSTLIPRKKGPRL